MSERVKPPRRPWLPAALPAFFGSEPTATDPWAGLLDVIAKFDSLTTNLRIDALGAAAELEEVDTKFLQCTAGPTDRRSMSAEDLRSPMRVVLMGRTMAGKSSLLAALTGAHVNRIGDGGQRFSHDVFSAATTASDRIEIVDTPGVGAHGGTDDTQIALRAALEADLIVWVNSSDSIQEESAGALRLLGAVGKPIIVALNCRQSLEGVGRLNLLRFPDRVFGNRDGLVEEIKRHMAEVGVAPQDVVHVHALAATEALARGALDAELHQASRIETLVASLLREHALNSENRRAIRIVDGPRQTGEELATALRTGSINLLAHAERDLNQTADLHTRLARTVRLSGEAMRSDIQATVGRRRDWHLNLTDFGTSLQSEWEKELTSLQEDLKTALGLRLSGLTTDVDTTLADTESEWAAVSPDQFELRELSGFNAIWGNRLLRAGVGVGGSAAGVWGGAILGAKIGGVLGLETGPGAIVTAAVGAIVGGVVGISLGPIKNLSDRIVLGKDGVLRKRSSEVAEQVGPLLDLISLEYESRVSAQLDEIRNHLAAERVRSDDRSISLQRLARRWEQASETFRDLIGELDRETTAALLRLDGRERLARSVNRATRVPGVTVLAEFSDPAFWEAWLFPPDIGEPLAAGKTPAEGGEAVSALTYALGLVDAPATLGRANTESATIQIEAAVPDAITVTWAEALSAHTRKNIRIVSPGKATNT